MSNARAQRQQRLRLSHLVADDSLEARIGRRIMVHASGCWLWRGVMDKYGRVIVSIHGVKHSVCVHRWVYQTMVGEIPDDHHIHHICRNPGCVNPQHLVALSASEHQRIHALERGEADETAEIKRKLATLTDDELLLVALGKVDIDDIAA